LATSGSQPVGIVGLLTKIRGVNNTNNPITFIIITLYTNAIASNAR
jgi:hypothetical protein